MANIHANSIRQENAVPTIRRFLVGATALLVAVGGQLMIVAGSHTIGALLLLGAAVFFASSFRSSDVHAYVLQISTSGWRKPQDWLVVGAVLAASSLAVAGVVLLDVNEPSRTFWIVYLISLAPLILVPFGWKLYTGFRHGWQPSRSWLWLLAILAIATATRTIALSTLPFGVWYDEAANGLEALRIINEPQYKPVYTDGVNASGHYLYLIVAAFELLGINVQSIRLISAVAGVATVGAAYLVGRELYGKPLGLVLAFMMAISRWAINFSRLGMYNTMTPLFELLALAFLLRALRRNRFEDYVLAGVSLGLGLSFYAAYQLFLAALGVFLLYVLITRWRPGSRFWVGTVLMAISALVVIAPLIEYAYERPDSYFARVQNTSIFAGKSPDERAPALIENTRRHLLMFNVRGDPNGRHNLPGEPMLDPVIASLFVIGVALSLWRLRNPVSVLLLLWFGLGLMGGILSLDFEAPQSLRSIATMPVVYILALMPLYALNEEWQTQGGRYTPTAAIGFVALLLLPAAAYNINTYFLRQASEFASWNAFSTPETLAAQELNSLPPDTRAYVVSLFNGHPTIRFLTDNSEKHESLDTTATLPIVEPSESNLQLILDAERRDLYQQAVRLYPEATHQEMRPPFGGPAVLYSSFVSQDDRAAMQGFTGVYRSLTDPDRSVEQKDQIIDFNWPVDAPIAAPFAVEWTGVLAASSYGPYQFALVSPASAALYINETVVAEKTDASDANASLILPKGLHQIRVEAESGEGPVRLLWRTPDRDTEVVPSWTVFSDPVTNNGLLGKYFPNGEWAGEPVLEQVDSGFDMYFHIPVLQRPYTVEWTGKIAVPEAGKHGFGVKSNDESELYINGELLASSSGNGAYTESYVTLESGLHEITIRYADRSDHTFITVYWIPPPGLTTQGRQVLPSAMLFPPQGNYERIAMPELSDLGVAETPAPTVAGALFTDSVDVEVVVEEVAARRNAPAAPGGVALAPGGIVVALPEAGQVMVFTTTGEVVGALDRPSGSFVEPFDVSVDADGNLFVLDAGSGEILHYDRDLQYVGTLPIEPEHLNRARGIGSFGSTELWIAKTPGGEVVKFDSADESIFSIPVKQHLANFGESQPVDVATLENGDVYITDSGVHKLSRYNMQGMRLWSIDLPVSNSYHGSHLAASSSGTVYVTAPEKGTILEVDSGGSVVDSWSLRVEDGSLVKPVGIAVDEEGAIYVSDVEGRRILRFIPPKGDDGEAEGSG